MLFWLPFKPSKPFALFRGSTLKSVFPNQSDKETSFVQEQVPDFRPKSRLPLCPHSTDLRPARAHIFSGANVQRSWASKGCVKKRGVLGSLLYLPLATATHPWLVYKQKPFWDLIVAVVRECFHSLCPSLLPSFVACILPQITVKDTTKQRHKQLQRANQG